MVVALFRFRLFLERGSTFEDLFGFVISFFSGWELDPCQKWLRIIYTFGA